MTLCYQCGYKKYMDIHKHEVIEQCLKCLTRNGYYWNGTEWTYNKYQEPDCKDCVHFVEGDFYHSKCPDDCIEPTGPGIIKHMYAAKAATSPAKASEPKGDDISLPNTNSLSAPSDSVSHPSHYTQGKVECIEAIKSALTEEEFRGYCKGNALKYIWRERFKGQDESILKAEWYLNRLIAEIERGKL
jgi:hypothetical protein